MGDAIRSLREDIPLLFEKDLNYEIYRDDILFKDPNNTFQGIKNYKTIWSSLRFSGKMFFKKLYVEVKRIWQPPSEDGVIKVRWTVHGIPRVIWQEEGLFDGISTYKLDDNGRVYEHSVDNVLLRDPPMFATPPIGVGLNLDSFLGRRPQQAPVPGIYGCTAQPQEAPEHAASTSSPTAGAYDVSSLVSTGLLAVMAALHQGGSRQQAARRAVECSGREEQLALDS